MRYGSGDSRNGTIRRALHIKMVIDHLGSGGAERQFCMLAKHLTLRGFEVEVVVFQPGKFSADALRDGGVPVVSLRPRNLVHLIYLIRRKLRRGGTDVVIAFLKWSSLIVELAGLPRRSFITITSERSLDLSGTRLVRYVRYCFHFLADAVVSNSFAQRDQMLRLIPTMKPRLKVIVNGVDLDYFKPAKRVPPRQNGTLHVLVLGRFSAQKNPFGLLDAVTMLRSERPELDLIVDWYGYIPSATNTPGNSLSPHRRSVLEASSIVGRLEAAITERSLGGVFRLHGVRKDVLGLYHGADLVCLPSFYEGCSNVIGEALACGVPVLASRVSDNGRLVQEGRTGFLFDPTSPRDIADVIVRYAALPPSTLRKMALEGRRVAEMQLSPKVFGDSFTALISQLWPRNESTN